MDNQNFQGSALPPTTPEISLLYHWRKRRKESQEALMNLHLLSMTEFSQLTIDEKLQALIEWKLQYDGIELELDAQAQLTPKWWFYKTDPPTQRAQKVREYEQFIDSLRSAPGFEKQEVKVLVQERRRALIKAVEYPTNQTLNELLSKPGFERFHTEKTSDTFTQNKKALELYGAGQIYPAALLYNLFNDPPDFLQQPDPLPNKIFKETVPTSILTQSEQFFIQCLQDSAKNAPEGWLTLEQVNTFNNLRSSQKKVFKPRNSPLVSLGSVKGLIHKLRKRPEYADAIETDLKKGQRWRLRNWHSQ